MGDGRVDQVMRDARSRGTELRRSAATKRSELASRGAGMGRRMRQLDVPWARCGVARMAREAILDFCLAPLMDFYTRARVYGRERFEQVRPPVVFVANHSSHLDTPTILRALPRRWRQRTAVAAAADYFYKRRAVASMVALIFNTVPIARRSGGEGSTEQVDRLLDQRWNVLMFPEGTRSRDGHLGKMRSGAAVIAQQHHVPIVPIYVKGTHQAMPPGRNWPKRLKGRFFSRRHRVEVHFGAPIVAAEGENRHELMERVKAFLEAEDGNGSARRGADEQRPLTPAG
jgi:1-acyl-sn-glycerol-3-phosphate acyltransferase